jgi:hypothetical protein
LLRLWCHDGGDGSGKLQICLLFLLKLQLPIYVNVNAIAVGKSEADPGFQGRLSDALCGALCPTKWTDFPSTLIHTADSIQSHLCSGRLADTSVLSQSFIIA